ncbi:MAG: hypothetical protein LIO75_01600 [Lachnospiraceae bacterium]|nr:hypothetical protein [Lachnospiraceae bacterium]
MSEELINNSDGDAARPALNLDLDSVLFTSAAADGKSSGAAGADALTEVPDYSGSEWKLTILDTGHTLTGAATTDSLAVTGNTKNVISADTTDAAYTGSSTGSTAESSTGSTAGSSIGSTAESTGGSQTGDNRQMALWIGLLFISGVGLFAAGACDKKRRHGKDVVKLQSKC